VKVCIKCGVPKPLAEFYSHPRMADKRFNKCKECAKVDAKQNYADQRPKFHRYEQERNRTASRRAQRRRAGKLHRERNPDKAKARDALKNAVRDGRVVRQPCVHCGSNKAQGHHTDYSKPLEVVWACFKCHREREHGQVVTATGG
jgi:hypothetical protein